MKILLRLFIITVLSLSNYVVAGDKVELETTFIKGNKELPQVLYIVPWKKMDKTKQKQETLVLHSLFGDAFEPVTSNEGDLSPVLAPLR